jgi:Rad3-related DNA helicase
VAQASSDNTLPRVYFLCNLSLQLLGAKKVKLTKASSSKCSFHNRSAEKVLSDRILGQLRDIEDTAALGHDTATCPYYASRAAVQQANVVCLPYNMLLSADMRESLGIDLAGGAIVCNCTCRRVLSPAL